MKRRHVVAAVAAVAVLAVPGPASGDPGSGLGGYSASAQAIPLRLQIFEPVIPIPTSPQIDGGIGLTRATTDTGPVSRALASYLWPGDTVGDGFGTIIGSNATYPVQINSRNPPRADSPATNAAQLTDGNGMTTSSSDAATVATVTGLGIAGPGVDLLGGLGKGLDQLGGTAPASAAKGVDLPVPVSATLSSLATIEGLHSTSSVTLGASSVTASSSATLGTVKLLGGLVALGGVQVSGTSTSDGTKATGTGSATVGSLSIAGTTFSFGDKGLRAGSSSTAVPALPTQLTSLLGELGISITPFLTTHTADGPEAGYSGTALQVTIDTGTLKQRLGLGALLDTLGSLLAQLPNTDQLQALLGLGPKFVFRIGDVTTSASASPPYGGGTGAGAASGPVGTGAAAAGDLGGGSGAVASGGDGAIGGAPAPSGPVRSGAAPVSTSYTLPGLGAVPKALVLAGIGATVLLGWLLSLAGLGWFGGAAACADGAAAGVPDLRRGR